MATAGEAAALRALGIDTPILVMGALTPAELRVALDAQADVVAWSDEVAAAVPRVHVKLDTGMGRLGTQGPRAGAAAGRGATNAELAG